MISPILVATQGVGSNPLVFALDGLVDIVQVQPQPQPQPKPPTKKRKRRASVVIARSGGSGSGGGLRTAARLVKPPPLEIERNADLVLIHTDSASIKAVAEGIAEEFIDEKGRRSVVITADDGTRYWYADVGEVSIKSGARVQRGASIGRTKPGAPALPPRVSESRPKPAQPVFVEAPAQHPRYRLVRLVPIGVSFAGEAVRSPEITATPIGPIVFSIVAVAAVAIALLKRRQPRRRSRRRPRLRRRLFR